MAIIREILIDTNIYTGFRRADPDILTELRRADTIALCPVVIAELLSGFRGGTKEAENQDGLEAFLATPRVKVVAITDVTAAHYSHVYQRLREKGRPIPTNDMWIAACALQHGFALYSLDGHFASIDGLLTYA